jgi:BMFP domain-containing protein YqiC
MASQSFDPRFIDDLARRLHAAMPEQLRALQEDVHGNFKAVLQSALGRLDLVTREEFDLRADMLKALYDRVEELEARVAEFESGAAGKGSDQP